MMIKAIDADQTVGLNTEQIITISKDYDGTFYAHTAIGTFVISEENFKLLSGGIFN